MNKVWQTPNFVINEWVATLKSHYNPFKYPDKIQAGLPSMFLQLGKRVFMSSSRPEKIQNSKMENNTLELNFFELFDQHGFDAIKSRVWEGDFD